MPLRTGQRRAIRGHLIRLRLDLLLPRGQCIHGQIGFEFPHLRGARLCGACALISSVCGMPPPGTALHHSQYLVRLLPVRNRLRQLRARHIHLCRPLSRLQIAQPRLRTAQQLLRCPHFRRFRLIVQREQRMTGGHRVPARHAHLVQPSALRRSYVNGFPSI